MSDPQWLLPRPRSARPVFGSVVAASDPARTRLLIWTQLSLVDPPPPGSGVRVRWEVAADPAFTDVLHEGRCRADEATDHVVKVEVAGLRPGTRYWFRFRALGETSPTGTARTLAGPLPVAVGRLLGLPSARRPVRTAGV